jgi:hypothetical protein
VSHQLFSINFSWGTMDRTWRWRRLPPAEVRLFANDEARAAEAIVLDPRSPTTVWPETLRLREDMTLHLGGTAEVLGKVTLGRWFQPCLPADDRDVPEPAPEQGLTPRKPPQPFPQPWDFLPLATFDMLDRFSHFGVYARVNSRSQFYTVKPEDGAGLDPATDDGTDWTTDDALAIDGITVNFAAVNAWIGGALDPAFGAPVQASLSAPPSLFRDLPKPRFRLLFRPPLGWIAVHADKRDDDLRPFSGLPRSLRLRRLTGAGAPTVRVQFVRHVHVHVPPAVKHARVEIAWAAEVVTAVTLTFTVPTGDETREGVFRTVAASREGPLSDGRELEVNIFRVKLAALRLNGTTVESVSLLEVQRHGQFTGVGDTALEETFRATMPVPGPVASDVGRYASRDGRLAHGTSLWFEGVTGLVATPEVLEFTA